VFPYRSTSKVKERISPVINAHLIRGAFYLVPLSAGILLALFRPEATAKVSHRTLTLAERVAYQRTIERIAEGNPPCLDDTWIATSNNNAPWARANHTAVWTGSEMIVWGGESRGGVLNAGGRYNPSTDSWTPTSTTNAPTARYAPTAVWTGSEMVVWGGVDGNGFYLNTGARYNPNTDTWVATSINNAPSGRLAHTAVWTGDEMIVWGGYFDPYNGYLNTGGRYNPGTNTWIPTTTTNAPSARSSLTAIWTGNEMIVWGGYFYDGTSHYLDTGARYNPGADTWTAASTTNAPTGRAYYTAVWTANQMIVWGGYNNDFIDTGGRYCAQFAPTPTPSATATPRVTPTPRSRPTPAPRPTPP
jgi:N-acetylneuraminic acid mutarotase